MVETCKSERNAWETVRAGFTRLRLKHPTLPVTQPARLAPVPCHEIKVSNMLAKGRSSTTIHFSAGINTAAFLCVSPATSIRSVRTHDDEMFSGLPTNRGEQKRWLAATGVKIRSTEAAAPT